MEVKIYKAFIASPSDTEAERNLCDKIFDEINSGLGDIYKFRIESLKWEKDVRPSIKDKDGQSTIFEQIGEDFEIFIGIMNKKFGSPTQEQVQEQKKNLMRHSKDIRKRKTLRLCSTLMKNLQSQ